MTTTTHRITWWGVEPTDRSRVRRNQHMNGGDWGWDATCTCGWDSRTGGALQERIREAIADHRWDVGERRPVPNPYTTPPTA